MRIKGEIVNEDGITVELTIERTKYGIIVTLMNPLGVQELALTERESEAMRALFHFMTPGYVNPATPE